jgi:hypothetical protein
MAGNGQRPESAIIPAILECYKAEWNDDKQDRLFVNVPAEKERRVTAERHGADKGFPRGFEEESEKNRLDGVS